MTSSLDPADFATRIQSAARVAGFRVEPFGAITAQLANLPPADLPLFALTKRTPAPRPRIYLSAGIHGDEPAGPLALLELLERGAFDSRATWFLCPLLNPAGFVRRTRENADGIDLNRDYKALRSLEIQAHARWLQRQPNFDLSLCLHEDWESTGYYLYELNPEHRPSLAPAMIAAVEKICCIDAATIIDGREVAERGIIRPINDPLLRDLWPESIYLRAHHTRLSYTLETPSAFPDRPADRRPLCRHRSRPRRSPSSSLELSDGSPSDRLVCRPGISRNSARRRNYELTVTSRAITSATSPITTSNCRPYSRARPTPRNPLGPSLNSHPSTLNILPRPLSFSLFNRPPPSSFSRLPAFAIRMIQLTAEPFPPRTPRNSARRVLLASLAGTTIEFFDFYIYATAAVLVFPHLFFPASDENAATLQSLATFALAFFARPVGSALFGHFGDRIGRKATLVAALLTMGLSTVFIGLLPTYASIGILAPVLLALCRLGQGLGLGGEWGGAVLLATENAPPGRRAWYGMFPQLGAPLGFFGSGGIFILLSEFLTNEQFLAWGWRVPFLASSVLVFVGLWVRLKISETPAFQRVMEKQERVAVPVLTVFRHHGRELVLGTLIALATFVIFYLLTVFCLSWGTSKLGFTRERFLIIQLVGVLFFGATIPYSAVLADRIGRRLTLIVVTLLIIVFGLALGPLFTASTFNALVVMILGFSLMGMTYGPLGTLLSELFPAAVRYTGASVSFNLAGIFGASLAPSIARWLATEFGLASVGYYLSAAALLTLLALYLSRETRDTDR